MDNVIDLHKKPLNIDPRWARVLVSCWDSAVIRPSSFEVALFTLIEKADADNRDLIRRGYPEAVYLADLWNKVPGAADAIRQVAGLR